MKPEPNTLQIDQRGMPTEHQKPVHKPDVPILSRSFLSLCLLGIFFLAAKADPVDTWNWRNPLPQGENLNAVAYGNGYYVAVGGNSVAVSTNLLQWDAKVVTFKSLAGVAYGNGKFVAVGADWNHPSGCILTSSDNGTSWTESATSDNYLAAVTFGGGRFVAVGAAGLVLTSSNGIQWSEQSAGPNEWLTGVTWGQGKYVAVSYNGHALISANGQNWTLATPQGIGFANVDGVAFGNGVFVAVNANSGSMAISGDAINWTTKNSGRSSGCFGITYGENGFMAVGLSGSIATSMDGTNWIAKNLPGINAILEGSTQTGSNAVIVGERGLILTSTNGVDWQQATKGRTDAWHAIAYGNGRFVAPGYRDSVILTSTNGVQWDEYPLPNAGQFRSVAWGNDTFLAVGNAGSVCTSSNGVVWTDQSSGTALDIEGIACGHGLFIAVGKSGLILASTTGSNWNSHLIPEINTNFHSVAFGDDRFVVVGDNGAVFVSADGTNWLRGQSARTESLQDIVYGNHRFAAFTDSGNVIISPNGTDWTNSQSIISARAIGFGGGYFLAASERYGLWVSSDGLNWQNRPILIGKIVERLAFGENTFVAVGDGGIILQSDPLPPTIPVTVQSEVNPVVDPFPVQRGFIVDGETYSTIQAFDWAPGSSHTIAAIPVQEVEFNYYVRYVWNKWSNEGSIVQTVSPTTTTNYTATFYTQFLLTMTTAAGGSVSPATGWVNAGDTTTISAVPERGCVFSGWQGDGFDAYTGTNATVTITNNGPIFESASFIDPVRPTNFIISPKPGQVWSNELFTVKGKASDNAGVESVFYQINGGDWNLATLADDGTNWTGTGALIEGTNVILAFAADVAGNFSATNYLKVNYHFVPSIRIITTGRGTVIGATNRQQFEIGKIVSLKTTPAAGYVLANWSVQVNDSNVLYTNKAVPFVMQSNLLLTATFADVAKPTLTITSPKLGQRWSNALFAVSGTVTDNGPGDSVWYQLNGGTWIKASGWNYWVANVTLLPGTNTIKAYAVDAAGNHSATNSQKVVYVLASPIKLNVVGKGTVNGIKNGQVMELGTRISATATAGRGYLLTNWLVQVGGTTVISTNRVASFVVESNLVLTATFADMAKPTLSITSPKSGQRSSNELFTITGRVTDNGPGDAVWYQLNGSLWNTASGWSNWSAKVTLIPGTNTVRAYAIDAAGNRSLTNSQKIVYVLTYWLPDYYGPIAAGNRKVYDGIDPNGVPQQYEVRIVDTNYQITCYSGNNPVKSQLQGVVRERSKSGTFDSVTGQFMSTSGASDEYLTMSNGYADWGLDDDQDSLRLYPGFVVTNRLALGQTVTQVQNFYNYGVYMGQGIFKLQLLDVVDVTVPAGTFTNCLHIRVTGTAGGQTTTEDSWNAAGFGTVKIMGVSSDDPTRLELIYSEIQSTDSSSSPALGIFNVTISRPNPEVSPKTAGAQGKQFGFRFSGPAGRTLVVEGSTNLIDWVPLQTNTLSATPVQFIDKDSAALPQRFYRLRQIP